MLLPLFATAAEEPPLPTVPGGAPAFGTDPAETLRWALERTPTGEAVMTTSFGMEGCVLMHMLHHAGLAKKVRVVTIDTGFHFAETHGLAERCRAAFPGFTWERAATDLTPAKQAAMYGERLWETKPDLCCALRKVEPLRRALEGASLWITALKRGASAARQNLEPVMVDPGHRLLKVAPLAHLTRGDVWEYVRDHDVPYNPLHEQGYPSIGCTHCTKPVAGATPTDDTRAGRWSGKEKTECGLHYNI